MAVTSRRTGAAARRVAVAALAVAAVTAAPAAAGASPTKAVTERVNFTYSGSESGTFSAIGKLTSFTPPVLYKTLDWEVRWSFACTGSLTYEGKITIGTAIACNDKGGSLWGDLSLRYLAGTKSDDCFSDIVKAPDGVFRMGGTVRTPYGLSLRVTAGIPTEKILMLALDPCGYPPAVDWHGPINTIGITHFGTSPYANFPRNVAGDMSGWQGQAKVVTTLKTSLASVHAEPPPKSWWQQFATQLGQWVGDQVDALRTSNADDLRLPTETPTLAPTDLLSAYLLGEIVTGDPTVLLKFAQRIPADTATPLDASLSSATLERLARETSPPVLHIRLTVTPSNGPSLEVAETYVPTLVPSITSVTFAGSATDPTVTVHGEDLGSLPKPDPTVLEGTNGCPSAAGDYGTDYGAALSLTVPTANWGAGRYLPGTEVDCIGILPKRSSESAVTFKLGSFYTDNPKQSSLKQGDLVELVVNGASIEVHVEYGATVTS